MIRKKKTETGPDAYNIKVERGKVFDRRGRVIGGRVGIFNIANGDCLGIHSNNYGDVQYPDLKQATDNAILISDLGVEREQINFTSTLYQSTTCGEQTGGERDPETEAISPIQFTGNMGGRVSMRWSLPTYQETDVVTGDPLSYFFEVDASHDGGWAIPTRTGIHRVACLNGLTLDETIKKTKFKHTKNIDIKMIVSRINESIDVFKDGVKKYGQLFEELSNTAINHYEGENIIKSMSFQKRDRDNIMALWSHPFQWRGYSDDRRPSQGVWTLSPDLRKFQSIDLDGKRWKQPVEHGTNGRVGDLLNCITQHMSHTCTNKVTAAQRSRRAFRELLEFTSRDRGSEESLRMICEPPPLTRTRKAKAVNALVVEQDVQADADQFNLF